MLLISYEDLTLNNAEVKRKFEKEIMERFSKVKISEDEVNQEYFELTSKRIDKHLKDAGVTKIQ